ncbi:PREDICTED: uncharacterized protein LOC108773287 [Cyphomyrmex costatus]|uniref:uncharacterized protein LOC108773287 n=1 Tax=Cyphomyrmex costatus TaxID=456900 RepID=UPI0008522D3A|nr:PREDICTED: uncharacterized protein LOC108773287 [Cyphomyrmex costatus]
MLGDVDSSDQLTLHTFCDASQSAYAAVIFIRIEKQSGIEMQFVQAKSRIALVKNVTIPRLELLAATIATRLTNSVLDTLQLIDVRTHWRHVPGALNPADLPSRGCSVRQLLSSNWWEGPQWLRSPVDEWPAQNCSFDDAEINKEKRKSCLTPVVASIETLLTTSKEKNTMPNYRKTKLDFLDVYRFSNYQTILRVITWVKRFISNSRNKKELREKSEISVVELKESEITLRRLVQGENFIDKNDDRIRYLNAFKDDRNIIRLSTKITMRKDTKGFRYPIVLPADCYIVRLIIREKHEQLLHAGVQILMNKLREQFWILGGRRTVRSVVRQCVVCRRHDAKDIQVITAPLPEDQVRDAAIFEIVGIDLAGPVFLKGSQKAWIVLFTCAVYRAIQLELVTSLSTVSFLEAFRQFVARRGKPTVVYPDNGKNFVGLNNLFSKVNWDEVAKVATEIKEIDVPNCDQIEEQKLDKKFAYRQKIKDDLRSRFRVEYLGELLHHNNNKRKEFWKIQVGDIVLVEDENKKRIEWPLARVKDVIFGRDNEVRVVRLVTASGELIRPVQKVYPLELTSDKNKSAERSLINEKSDASCNSIDSISEASRYSPVESPIVTRSERNVKKPKRFL